MPSPSWVQGRLQPEPAATRFIYNTFFKRASTYMGTVMVVATFGGIGYDYVMNYIWDSHNKGVRAARSHARRPHGAGSPSRAVPSLPSSNPRRRPPALRRAQKQWKDIKHKYEQ